MMVKIMVILKMVVLVRNVLDDGEDSYGEDGGVGVDCDG